MVGNFLGRAVFKFLIPDDGTGPSKRASGKLGDFCAKCSSILECSQLHTFTVGHILDSILSPCTPPVGQISENGQLEPPTGPTF